MSANYQRIDLVAFFNDAIEFDVRSTKVELGQGGVINRARRHFKNATKRSFNVNATLRDRDTLQQFLETNRGRPFEYVFDGQSGSGLFITKNWTWTWIVFAEGAGVWRLTMKLEEVFRAGWPFIKLGPGFSSGVGFDVELVEFGDLTIEIPIGLATGVGFDIEVDDTNINIPLGLTSGVGFDIELIPGEVAVTLPLGVATGFGNNVQLSEVIRIALPLGTATGIGDDIELVPGDIEVAIALGQSGGTGFDIGITPVIAIELGLAAGTGFDIDITPVIAIDLGEASGVGNDVQLVPGEVDVAIVLGQTAGVGFDVFVGEEPWTPSEITTAIWLDAADASSITIESGAISEWRDKSGNNRHMQQSSVTSRPVIAGAAYNGKNAVLFDGVNDRLDMVSTGLNLARNVTALTVFHVVEIFASSNNNQNIFRVSTNTMGGARNMAGTESFGYRRLNSSPFTLVVYGFSPAIDTLTMTSHITDYGNGLAFVSRNGSSLDQYATLIDSGATSNTDSAGIWIGSNSNLYTAFTVHGRICEIITLRSVPTTIDRQKIEGYLAHKWGLVSSLPTEHPYKNDLPTI
jgi:hypothetical protein